jgi:hypothetical protein
LDLGTSDSCPIMTAADSTVREALHLHGGPEALRTQEDATRKAKHWMTASSNVGLVVARSFLHPDVVKTLKHDAGE